MRGVQLLEPGHTELREVPIPDAEGRALVRVQTVGVCGTDSSIIAGKIPASLPQIMGHEAVGAVEQAGPLGAVPVGQRVLIDPAVSCDLCDLCRRGYPNLCRNGGLLGRDFDGVFADYVAVDERQLIVVPESITSQQAGLIQVLGTCVHAVRTAPTFPGDVAVVLGLGVGGQLIAQLLTSQGARVIGVTRSQSKRDLASELGAHLTVAPDEAKDAVANETDGRGANIVIEAVGTEATFSQAINLAGHASTVVLFGTTTGGSEGLPYYQFYFKEITIKNPRAATKSDYERSIALIASGTVQVERIISRNYSLNDANDAFAAVKESSTLKILMDVAGS